MKLLEKIGIGKNGKPKGIEKSSSIDEFLELSSNFGKHTRRAGASSQGSLSNLNTNPVSKWTAEFEKVKVDERAAYLYQNDSIAKGIVKSNPIEIVNTGITPLPEPKLNTLGRSFDWKQEFQKTVFDKFEIWGLSPNNYCDRQERCNYYMLQSLAIFNWALHGLAIFQIVKDTSPGRPLMLSLLPICPTRVQTPTNLKFSSNFSDGFELDDAGKIIAIHVLVDSTRAATGDNITKIPVKDSLGFPNVLIITDVENIAEYRQDSILSCMIKNLIDNNSFFDATIVKSNISNLWAMFVENQFTLQQQQTTRLDWEDRAIPLEAGTIFEGLPGEKASVIESDHPGPNYEAMVKSVYDRLGAATGKGFEQLLHSYTASYSASRASIENADMYNEDYRKMLNNRMNQPVMDLLIYEMGLRNEIPGFSFSEVERLRKEGNLYALTKNNFLPPPRLIIDRLKDAKADTEQLNNLTGLLSAVYATQGKNWEEELEKRARELKKIKQLEEENDIKFNSDSVTESDLQSTLENNNIINEVDNA